MAWLSCALRRCKIGPDTDRRYYMHPRFEDIPPVVIDYVRELFAVANDKVSRTLTRHPAMHEESLDHVLVSELTAAPPAFFADERIAISVETHWLGGRRMYGRWEIADIALFVILRNEGHAELRKAALLQTKRLYSKEISVSELDETEFRIGIGRIADRPDRLISRRRAFSFDPKCVYGAIRAADRQTRDIDAYTAERNIPVYYALYHPLEVPSAGVYPADIGADADQKNVTGCRVLPAPRVHAALAELPVGKTPSFDELLGVRKKKAATAWRLEEFVADEVLRCREGALFPDAADPNLQALFYERSAPIQAAISITVDFGVSDTDRGS